MASIHSSILILLLVTTCTVIISRSDAFSPYSTAIVDQSVRTTFFFAFENTYQRRRRRRRRGRKITENGAITVSDQKGFSSTSTYLYSLSRNDGFSPSNGISENEVFSSSPPPPPPSSSSSSSNNGKKNVSNSDDSLAPSTSSVPTAVILSRDIARQTLTYEASFPLYQTATTTTTTAKDLKAVSNTIGMTLRQVDRNGDGQMSNVVLDMDTLQYISVTTSNSNNNNMLIQQDDDEHEKNNNIIVEEYETVSDEFIGVIVSSVKLDGIAYQAGVRPGDVVLATSATMGDVSCVLNHHLILFLILFYFCFNCSMRPNKNLTSFLLSLVHLRDHP